MTEDRAFPQAAEHGPIGEVFEDIYFVAGTTVVGRPFPMRFSRNMTIIRQRGELFLVNSLRLNEAGLAELDRLGKVTHVVRLAGFHGMDDPFYKDRYGAQVWSVDAPYAEGLNPSAARSYFTPDIVMGDTAVLPIDGARPIVFASSTPAEAVLLIDREGGIIVSGDCLQNWATADRYFNLPAKLVMRAMGFIKPHNIGPGWLKMAKPDPSEIKALLDLQFEHVLPAHGAPVVGNARRLYEPAIAGL